MSLILSHFSFSLLKPLIFIAAARL